MKEEEKERKREREGEEKERLWEVEGREGGGRGWPGLASERRFRLRAVWS